MSTESNSLFEQAVAHAVENYLSKRPPQITTARSTDDDEGIDAKEVARMMGYYKQTGEPDPWPVYELRKRGIIEGFRPSPGIWRFNRGKIRRFIDAGGCTEEMAAKSA